MAINATVGIYDLTNASSSIDLLSFTQNVNNLTGQFLMLGFLLATFVIFLISLRGPNVSMKDSFIVSSFITAVLSIFFVTLEFISTPMMITIVIIFGVIFSIIALRD